MSAPQLLRATAIGGVLLTGLFLSLRALSYFGLAPGGARRHHLEAAAFLFAFSAALGLLVSRRRSEAPEGSQRTVPVVAVLVAAAAAAIHASWSLSLGFLSDDFVLLTRAVEGRLGPGADWPYLRPVPLLLWRAIAYASDSPLWFHALNVSVHSANVALLFLLADRLGLVGISRLAAAGLFAFWPAHLEAVAWASGVQDLLMTLGVLIFLLGSFACRWVPALVGLAVAIGSKEAGVVAPFLGALFWVAAPRDRRPCASILATAGVLAGAYAVWRVTVPSSSTVYVTAWPAGYLLKELVGRPFAALAVPIASGVVPSWPVIAAGSVLTFAALACGAVVLGSWTNQEKALAIRLAMAVVVTVLPVYSLLHVSSQLEGSRYVYLGSAFWSLLLALFPQTLWRDSRSKSIAAHVLLSFTFVLWMVAHAWHRVPWAQAAEVRDRVLHSARTAAAGCGGRAEFTGAPDSIDGAYVFRNGLAEAVALGAPVRDDRASPADSAACRYVWKDDRFVTLR